jgi:hypothetical protein
LTTYDLRPFGRAMVRSGWKLGPSPGSRCASSIATCRMTCSPWDSRGTASTFLKHDGLRLRPCSEIGDTSAWRGMSGRPGDATGTRRPDGSTLRSGARRGGVPRVSWLTSVGWRRRDFQILRPVPTERGRPRVIAGMFGPSRKHEKRQPESGRRETLGYYV